MRTYATYCFLLLFFFALLFIVQKHFIFLFLYILLIMLLQLSHFFLPFLPLHPALSPPAFPTLSSCPHIVCIYFLASLFPILFLTSPCLFCTYHLCFLFPVPFPPFHLYPSLMITLHVISISLILFLF